MLVLFLVTAWAADRDLLLLGNSYTAANNLRGVVEEAMEARPAWPDSHVVALTHGGWTFQDHLAATERPGPWADAVASPWDVVVFQDQSQIPGFPQTEPSWLGSAEALAGLRASVVDADAALLLTWGRRDGDAQNPDLFPDFPTMQDRLTEGYLAYADLLGTVAVVPAGEAFRRVWEDDPEVRFRQLYKNDGSHPSPYGTFLVAATMHSALTGRDPAEVEAPWPGLDAAEVEALRQVVRELVLDDPFGPYAYPWAQDWVDGTAQIGAAGLRPVVRLQGSGEAASLVVGGADGDWPADGELWVVEGASLTVDTLTVGAEGTGHVDLFGTLMADRMTVGPGGTLAWTGLLEITRVEGDLVQDGGTLRARPGLDIEGTWTVVDGALDVLEVPTSSGEHVLVLADAIDASGLSSADGLVLEVVERDGRQALVTVVAAEAGTTKETAEPSDDGEEGCGCASSSGGWPWLRILARRAASSCHTP